MKRIWIKGPETPITPYPTTRNTTVAKAVKMSTGMAHHRQGSRLGGDGISTACCHSNTAVERPLRAWNVGGVTS